MLVKDLVRHDCFQLDYDTYQVLAWLWSAMVGPMVCVRQACSLVGLISDIKLEVKPANYDRFTRIQNSWESLGNKSKGWKNHREYIRVHYSQALCPELKTSESVRERLQIYKKGIIARKLPEPNLYRPNDMTNGFDTYRKCELWAKGYEDSINKAKGTSIPNPLYSGIGAGDDL